MAMTTKRASLTVLALLTFGATLFAQSAGAAPAGAGCRAAAAVTASAANAERHAHGCGSSTKMVARSTGYIVQAGTLAEARQAASAAGGRITHELGIIDGVAATLSPAQAASLRANSRLVLTPDRTAKVAGGAGTPDSAVPQVQANLLHAQGITGRGVAIAVVDTG